MRKSTWPGRLAVVVVLLLVGAACAKKSTSSTSSSACSNDPFKCVTYKSGDPIKIGTLLSITGNTAFLGTDSQHGAQLAVDYLDGKLDGKAGTLLGHPVPDFAYPYGDVDPVVAGLVAAAGFSDAVATSMGTVQCSASRYVLHRTRVGGGDTVWSFAAKAGVQAPPRGWQDAPRI